MSFTIRSIASLGLTLALSSALGCVTAGTHESMVGERDGLQQRADTLSADKAHLEGRVAELEADRSSLESSKQALEGQLNDAKSQTADLSGTYDALVQNLESELAAGQVEIQRVRDGIQVNVADDVLFPSGSAVIDERGREVLGKVADQLVATPNAIRVEGHTDDVPISGGLTARYPTNWELAGARAASVVRLLADDGIESTRMRAVSRGEFAPRESNETLEGRARNRRIEIRLLPTEALDAEIAGDSGAKPTSDEAPAAVAGS